MFRFARVWNHMKGSSRMGVRFASNSSGQGNKKQMLDVLQIGTGIAFGIVAAKAYRLASEWPEGNQLLFNSMRDDKVVRNAMGYPIIALPTWEGISTDDTVRIEVPVVGTKCMGTLTGAAVKQRGQWVVLACEMQPTFVIRGGSDNLPAAPAAGQASQLESPPPASLNAAVTDKRSYDVIAKRWMDSMYSIGAESDFTKEHAHTKAHLKVVGKQDATAGSGTGNSKQEAGSGGRS